jgi:hypothetical protein
MGNIMVDTSKKYVAWCNENKITQRHIHIAAINLSMEFSWVIFFL